MKIGFVTDSTADIPGNLAMMHGIEVVPAMVNIDNESYIDGVGISRQDFYTRLPDLNPPPTTSSPSVGAFQERYEKLFRSGKDFIISIHPPGALSGIYNAARLAAQAFNSRVSVMDSGQLSLGLGFQVLLAAEAATRGANIDEVKVLIERIHHNVRLAALLDTTEYIRRSGRVFWAVAMISSMLHLRPLIELRYGVVHRLGLARTHIQGIGRLLEALNSWGKLERLAVLHTNAELAARQLLEQVRLKVEVQPLLVNVTTVIGTHVGPNGLGFSAVLSRP